MDSLPLDNGIKLAIIFIGFFLALAVIDLKGKVKALDKLGHIDSILKDLKGVVNKLNDLVTKQEVSEATVRVNIEFLERKIEALEERVKSLEELRYVK
jgi:polyhydroxyalkanoate synthesis regulator phasin